MGIFAVLKTYCAVRGEWEEICERCSLCCHERDIGDDGSVAVDWATPCDFLDEETGLCTVYDHRFEACDRCHKVGLRMVLFNRSMPPSCAYVRLFRPLLHS